MADLSLIVDITKKAEKEIEKILKLEMDETENVNNRNDIENRETEERSNEDSEMLENNENVVEEVNTNEPIEEVVSYVVNFPPISTPTQQQPIQTPTQVSNNITPQTQPTISSNQSGISNVNNTQQNIQKEHLSETPIEKNIEENSIQGVSNDAPLAYQALQEDRLQPMQNSFTAKESGGFPIVIVIASAILIVSVLLIRKALQLNSNKIEDDQENFLKDDLHLSM